MRGEAVQGHGRWHGDHASHERQRLAVAAASDDGDEHVDGEEAKKAKTKKTKKRRERAANEDGTHNRAQCMVL